MRVPNSCLEGAASLAGWRRGAAGPSRSRSPTRRGAIVGTGSLGASPACDPGRRARSGLGVSATGPAHDHAAAPAFGRDHRRTSSVCWSCRCLADEPGRPGGRWDRRTRRLGRDPLRRTVSGSRFGDCSASPGRWIRAGLCSAGIRACESPFLSRRLFPRASQSFAEVRALGGVRLQRILAIPMGATALACIWLLERQAGERAV